MKKIIQVAGITDLQEAKMLMSLGVEYLGFPLRLPVNKEDLLEEDAAEIIKFIKSPHKAVLITYLNKANEIIDFCNKLGVKIVQLHGHINLEELRKLKSFRPDIEVIKSLVVKSDNLNVLEDIVQTHSPYIDLFITDTYDPTTGASGATGKTHDWNISKHLVKISSRPVIIAGGLDPYNVREAIIETNPAGVDVHTGIESANGRKDIELTKKFINEALQAFSSIQQYHL